MKTPKVIFTYSWIYDENLREWMKIYPHMKKWPTLSYEKVISFMKKMEKKWRKDEKKVLSELSKVSGLKWKMKSVKCYVVNKSVPFSDPLTMPVRRPDRFIDTLAHEMIHQLFIQEGNMDRARKSWDYIFDKYKKESRTTKIHIPLHAIHEAIFRKFYPKKRLENEIRLMGSHKDYQRSWEIVQKEGYQNIIKEFRKRLK